MIILHSMKQHARAFCIAFCKHFARVLQNAQATPDVALRAFFGAFCHFARNFLKQINRDKNTKQTHNIYI